MLYLGGLFGLVTLALWVLAIVDVITTDESCCRHLPKFGWLILVLFFPLVGSVVWFVAGRPQTLGAYRNAYEREVPRFPEYNRPGRFAATSPDDDEEFLRRCRERAEEQRRKGREL